MTDPFGLGEGRGSRYGGRGGDEHGGQGAETTATVNDADYADYYAVLGVTAPKSWTGEELATLYRRACREHHPDKHPQSQEHTQQFERLQEAYAVLGDSSRRAMYDRWLASGLTDSVSWNQWERHLMASHWRGESPEPKALQGTFLPEPTDGTQPSRWRRETMDQEELKKLFRTYRL